MPVHTFLEAPIDVARAEFLRTVRTKPSSGAAAIQEPGDAFRLRPEPTKQRL
jgi:hypothetical protein